MLDQNTPKWLNTEEYPFTSNYYETPAGKMHYVDEGEGEPILFVHGNPCWSFEFRHLIKELSKTNRCIAPDHLGFGLSDKPLDWSYLPKDHAKNFEKFIESLQLKDITIIVGDWGGPIGLSYVITHPHKVKNIVITNTWLWSVKNDWYYQAFSNFTGGALGRFLIKKYNFFVKFVLKSVFGNKEKFSGVTREHYLQPLSKQEERKGSWIFPKEITGSSEWLNSLWGKREVLKSKNILIAWGMKDIAFREKELNRWIKTLQNAKVIKFEKSGHLPAEENPAELTKEIKKLIQH